MFYKLLHAKKFKVKIPQDQKLWPPSWSEISFKQYPRLPAVNLPKVRTNFASLDYLLAKRISSRRPRSENIDLEKLSNILFYGAGIRNLPSEIIKSDQRELNKTRRFYPSGGARYPLEVYLVASIIRGLSANIYHYNVLKHSLEEISYMSAVLGKVLDCFNEEWVRQSSAIILITSLQLRSSIKYLNKGYAISLIETGHLAQNILLTATEESVATCPLYGFNRHRLQEVLDLGSEELVFYSIVLN